MKARATALPSDVQYILDSAVEAGDITTTASMACQLYGDVERLGEMSRHDVRSSVTRKDISSAIESYGLSLLPELPPLRRTNLLLYGMAHLCHLIQSHAVWLAEWHFEDLIRGGCSHPFRNVRLHHPYEPTPRLARRLHSRKAIRRYVHGMYEVQHLRTLFNGLDAAKVVPLIAAPDVEDDRQHDRDVINEELDVQRRDELAGIVARRTEVEERVARQASQKRRSRRTRSSIKKASAVAAALIGSASVSAFARGEPVMLRGETVAISAKLQGFIGDVGHGTLRVGLHDLDGRRLASLCVYQDAPVLDQLASLALHVAAGEEQSVIDAANFYAIEPTATSHPVLQARIAKINPSTKSTWFADRQLFSLKAAEYAGRMLPVYREIIAVHTFGRAYCRKLTTPMLDAIAREAHP